MVYPTMKGVNMYDEHENGLLARLDARSRELQLMEEDRKNEEALKNHRFAQLYFDSMDALAVVGHENGLAVGIFLFLARRMAHDNSIVVSREALAHFFGVHTNLISQAIKVLKERGFIEVKKNGKANVYHLNTAVVWKTYGNLKHKASFNRTVYLDATYKSRLKDVDKTLLLSYTKRTQKKSIRLIE